MAETKMNVYEKLQGARVLLQKCNLKKSGKNTFAGFEYFELADFLPKVNEIFNTVKLSSVFDITEGTAHLYIINAENPEETITFSSPTAEANLKGCTPIQSLGGVHSYMKRYLYLNALEISDGDLFDSVSGSDKIVPSTPVSDATKAELTELGIDISNIAKYLKKPVELLTDDEVKKCIATKKRAAKKAEKVSENAEG